MSSAKPPPPQGPPPPNARKPGDPLNSTAGNRTSAAKPEPTAEKAGSKAEGASAEAGSAAGPQAERQAADGARQGSEASSSTSEGASASTKSQSTTSGAKPSSEQGTSASGEGQRKGARTTASAEKEAANEGGSGGSGGNGGGGNGGGGDGDGMRSRFADAWNNAKESVNEAPPEPPKKGSSLLRLLFGATAVGGAGVAYVGYLYSTDANTVRQLMESKSPLVPLFDTLGVPAAVKGPEFTIIRANLLHRIHAKLYAAGGGAVDINEATDVICKLNPELAREQVEQVLLRRSQTRDGTVPQGAFVAVGRDALRGVEDHDLFKKSKDHFEIQPISDEMYSLLGSLFETFRGAEDNAISVGDVKDFSAKLDLGGDETAGRLVETVDLPQTNVSGMGKEDFVNLIALLLINVPENRRIEKLQQQLKLYRIHQRERQRAYERANELAEEDAQRSFEDPFAADAEKAQKEREGKEEAAYAAASAPMASVGRAPQNPEGVGGSAPAGLAGIPLFDSGAGGASEEAQAAQAANPPATPELEAGVSSVFVLRNRLQALREEEASYLQGLPSEKPVEEQDKAQAAAFRDAKHRVKLRIKEVQEEAKASSAAQQ